MGRSRRELIGINQARLHPPEEGESYKEKFYGIIKAAKELGNSHNPSMEAEILNSKGERVPVYISASLLELGGKKVVQSIFRDISELKRIEREKKEAEALALIDPHTQLYNYRYLQRRLHSEFELAKRRATPLSILMVDIDYFKSVNDTYGHEYGDAVLQEFAIVLQHASRGIDVVTRFEGEGFAIILPDTEGKGALTFGDRIQRIIKKHRFGANKVKLRISIGICSYPEDGIATVDHLLTNADKCVRFAKEQGGNTELLEVVDELFALFGRQFARIVFCFRVRVAVDAFQVACSRGVPRRNRLALGGRFRHVMRMRHFGHMAGLFSIANGVALVFSLAV